MTELEDGSVHLVVTSPPYWQLKDYGSTSEIGFNHSYEEYINHLNLVWNESYRVLDNGCRLCVNIGDQYARSVYYGRYKIIPIRTEIIRFCETIGFDYMGAIIWQKVATVNTSGGAVIMGSYPYPRNGIVKLDYEFILIFKKNGSPSRKPDPAIKAQSKMTKEEWNTYFYGHWNFPGEKQKKHLAMFPKELPYRLIKMFTFVGDTVLDPFAGSGTTTLAASELNRNSVGYEINREFIPIIKEKLGADTHRLFGNTQFNFQRQEELSVDFESEIKELPYTFKDPVKLDKKVADIKKMQFGSKIDKHSSGKREEYFRVKSIDSPERITLNDNRQIRLIGIKVNGPNKEKALAYLEKKLKGIQVFLKPDPKTSAVNPGEPVPYYLYLKNKTFINAHMIKEGLAAVDEGTDFKRKDLFLKYFHQAAGNA
jgi:site-specific DNA-methyltransferase (adenine-specific)